MSGENAGGNGKAQTSRQVWAGVFEPEFAAVCDTCGATTTWHKANRVAEVEDEPSVLKGYKCAECETFETKVLDTDGEIRKRG